MIKAFKYRIYPTKAQEVLLAKHFGCHRWVYNWGLNQKIEAYTKDKTRISRYDLQKQLPTLKKNEETKWLSEVNAQSLQISLEHLDKAYKRFFKEKKGFPKFKNKYSKQSYQCFNSVKVDFEKGRLKLPKFDWIKCVFTRSFEGKPKTTTITRTSTGKYYVSILAEVPTTKVSIRKPKVETSVGIDVGIKAFLTLSNGKTFENNRYLKNSIERLKVLQRRVSKKKKGSSNRKKANLKLAILHEKISNQRLDYIHKVTHELTNDSNVSAYCIEDLNIKGMAKNHNLAQALNDVSIGKFYEILGYKCAWRGISLMKIGRFEPSSKTCCKCGSIKSDLKLSDRIFKCECGNEIDRDLQASMNIKSFAFYPKTGQGISEDLVEVLPLGKSMKQELKLNEVLL